MEHREDHNEIPEFTLEDILAEFGSGSDLYRTEDLPAEENSPETAPAEAPAQQEASAEPEPHAEPETSAAAEFPRKPEGLRFTPDTDPVDMDFPAEVLEEVFFLRRPAVAGGGPAVRDTDHPLPAPTGTGGGRETGGGDRPRRSTHRGEGPGGGAAGNAGTAGTAGTP